MAVSQFVKMVTMVLVLHTVLDLLADEEAVDADGDELNKKRYVYTAKASAKLAQRQLAMDPDEMDTTLKSLAFTNNADTGMVQKIYRMTYEAVVTKVRELFYNSMTWITKEQWAAYCSGVLPQCPHLEKLDLWYNPNLEEDIVELVGKLPPTLKTLSLYNTGCFGDGGKADWSRLPALEYVDLRDTKVTWDTDVDIVELVGKYPENTEMLNLRFIESLTGNAAEADWSRLPALEYVNLSRTKVSGLDIVELVGKLPPTLKYLSLGNTGCFGDAGKADWGRLPALEEVGLYDTKVSGSKEELRAAGCKAEDIEIGEEEDSDEDY